VNPYDRHVFNERKQAKMGSDGSGTIFAAGEGVDPSLVGKKVSFCGEAWGKYRLSTTDLLLFLDDSQDLAKAANAFINPLTAIAQLHYAKRHGSKACISLAASSQLCKQFLRLAQQEGIETINIVRKEEQVKQLKEEYGAKYVLNQSLDSFADDLKKMVDEVQPTTLFEYVGGKLPA